MKNLPRFFVAFLCFIAGNGLLLAQENHGETPLIPGQKWHVHDPARPAPAVITPGEPPVSQPPPSDAIILFDGKDLSQWLSTRGGEAKWKIENGELVTAPNSSDIRTVQAFGDVQLHIEWASPLPVAGESQGRGNSGIFFLGCYELQILDCFKNPTYADGQAAAIYGQQPPQVNVCRPPGQWQTYDIIFIAPRFAADGKLEAPPYITVFHNGVVVQAHTPILGATSHKKAPGDHARAASAPLRLQDHGCPVRFRNIWARPLNLNSGN